MRALIVMIGLAGSAAAQTPQPADPGLQNAGTQGPVPQMRRRGPIEAPRAVGDCAAVPLDLGMVIPIVTVMIGDRGPYRFAIDTGAQGHGRIKRELAEQLGLAVAGAARTPGPGGTVEERPVFAVPSLTLGGIRFENAQLLAAPVLPGRAAEWDGILGIDLFRNFTLTLDYGNRRLHVGPQPLGAGLALAPDQPVLTFSVEIAGRSFPVHLDTGNQARPLLLAEADARSLPLTGEPVERGRARTSFGEFAIMEAPLGAPVRAGTFDLPVRTVSWPPARNIGNLGSLGLAGTVVRVDQRSRLIQIAASPTGAAESCPTG